MKATPTKTLNPLPFQDLEPHRFEDLVRQLAYDMRRWKSLEATGRGGSDEGLDIRAVEALTIDEGREDEDSDTDATPVLEERLWIFQCKREKALASKRLREVVKETLASLKAPPHGFVIAVACDVSKKTRDAFREEMVARGIREFAIWARGELEDMLFQAKNDRLLFAYFGLSLNPRRQALSSLQRSRIAKKKQLAALLDGEDGRGKVVLLRDPGDERYPRTAANDKAPPRWIACRALHVKQPGTLVVHRHEYLAATTVDRTQWDAITDHDTADADIENDLRSLNAWVIDEDRDRSTRAPHSFWNEYIAEADQASLSVYRFVPFDRIVAIDPLGDGYYPVPHIFVEFDDETGPFDAREFVALERGHRGDRIDLTPTKSNRADIFPKPLPGESDPDPKAFDDTSDATWPLTDAGGERLAAVLAKMPEEKKSTAGRYDDAAHLDLVRTKMQPFRDWRETVARPLFSAFVRKLRDHGHSARVVIRSVAPSPTNHHQAHESVELRVRLAVGSFLNPSYRPPGHVRVFLSAHGNWQIAVSPKPDDPRDRYTSRPAVKVEGMTAEQLETHVLAMLEQLQSRGY